MADTVTEQPTIKGPSFDFPHWEEWQTSDEYRAKLEASFYVDHIDVGRGVTLSGRVTFFVRFPHQTEWAYGGDFLNRDGPYPQPAPTDKMRRTAREALRDRLPTPGPALLARVKGEEFLRKMASARADFERKQEDARQLSEKLATAIHAVTCDPAECAHVKGHVRK